MKRRKSSLGLLSTRNRPACWIVAGNFDSFSISLASNEPALWSTKGQECKKLTIKKGEDQSPELTILLVHFKTSPNEISQYFI